MNNATTPNAAKEKKRLLYLVTRAEHGGAQVHVLDLLRGMQPHYNLALGVGEKGFLTDAAVELGIPVYHLPNLVQPISPRHDFYAFRETVDIIRQFRPDLIHAHSSKAGMIGRAAGFVLRTPSVFTAHGWAFAEGVSPIRKHLSLPFERIAALMCRTIITVSEADHALALRYQVASNHKIKVIQNGIPENPLRALPDAPGMLRIVMVARFAPPKNHLSLLRALKAVLTKKPAPVRIQMVGDGPMRRSVEEEALRLGLGDHVEFLGVRQDIAEILAQAHLFVLTSDWEGLPISIIEGMRAGLPVIASRVGGISELVCEGKTGFLIPRGDEGILQDRLERLIWDGRLRAQLGYAGRRRFEESFTLDQMLEKTMAVYEELGITRGNDDLIQPNLHQPFVVP